MSEQQPEVVGGSCPLPPADYIAETRQLYSSLGYDSYRWAERPEPPAFVPITKPVDEWRIAVIASGGIYAVGQEAFHTKDDTSIRLIPTDTPTADLRTAHFAYDQTDARNDPNCVIPLDALRGRLTPHAATFMGGIYSTRRLEEETVPALLEFCKEEAPDVVLLVPV
jgi:D-proline reductase (dithiol) PrdB